MSKLDKIMRELDAQEDQYHADLVRWLLSISTSQMTFSQLVHTDYDHLDSGGYRRSFSATRELVDLSKGIQR